MQPPNLSVPLMSAAERAGYRAACAAIRAEGARMRRSARMIGDGPASETIDPEHQQRKSLILDICGKAVELCAERAEAELQPLLDFHPVLN